jgi:hypothetical protein
MTANEWIAANDQALFERKATITEARKQCEKEIGRKVKPKEFKDARKYCCKYWKVMRRRREAKGRLVHWKKWDRIRVWVDKHESDIKEMKSLYVSAQVMLADGIGVSPSILENSSSFMSVWNRTHGNA